MQNAPEAVKQPRRCYLVAWGGIEPPTRGFSICQHFGVRRRVGR